MTKKVFTFTSQVPWPNNERITGAFGTFPGHDAHILSTLSAIQILVMQKAVDKLDKERTTKCKN